MRSRLLDEVAVLASERYQERYIVHGTKEQYVLPEEVLEAALGSAQNATQKPSTASLSASEVDAVREFTQAVEACSIDFQDLTSSNQQLIREDERWAAARTSARRLLTALNFDLEEWEQQEGLK